MELVKEAGGQAFNGLDMLIYQGIIAFELWNPNVSITDETVDEIRVMMKKRLEGKS